MKHGLRFFPLVIMMVLFGCTSSQAQSTYAQIYQMIQTNCAGAGCHDGSNSRFNINVSADSLYHELVNVPPVNATAAANYNMLVGPGDVQHSFLLRKISHGISDGLAITPAEGSYEPNGMPALANNQIELVRQWILYGAPETGTVVDTAMINKYYRSGGIDDTYSPHAAPDSGTGIQIYFGRFFLNAGTTDTEIYYKVNPHINQAIESYKVVLMEPASDHHFVMFLFQPGGDAAFPWGIRPLADASMEFDQYGIGAGPGLWSWDLPANTAFYFDQGQMFDLDVHIQNPSVDSIYSCDIYVNIYTEPANTTNIYMKTANFINTNISIPEDGQHHSFSIYGQDSTRTNYWKLWKLYSHTHKYGTAFNMWLLNPDGSQGEEIYDGNYNYTEGFDMGYYPWGPHVNVRTWPDDSLFQVNPYSGIYGLATWLNTAGPNPVNWGFSSADEMQVIFMMYVDGDPLATAITSPAVDNISARVFPNPVNNQFVISYNLTEPAAVKVDLLDALGNRIANLIDNTAQANGQYSHDFNAAGLSPGMYLVSFNIGGKTETQKLIITE